MRNEKVIRITGTALMAALLVTLQWLTAGFGQFVTGSCVNAVLVMATLIFGLWSGAAVAVLSPFCAFLLGIGPKLLQIVPAIALGNLVLVLAVSLLLSREKLPLWRQALATVAAAAAKFIVLYLSVVRVIVPAMGPAIPQKQADTFSAMFSWPQLVTALIGTALSLLILPIVRKAIKKGP